MDFHMEFGLRLHTEPQHKNLYSWAINEIDAQGQKVGHDQIPWKWTLNFTATSCVLADSLHITPKFSLDQNEPETPEITQSRVIRITLRLGSPQDDGDYFRSTTFRMFGTNRSINNFQLDIREIVDAAENERCISWGTVSYTTDIDFRDETAEDCVTFYLFVKPETFARYATRILDGSVNEIIFSVGSVAGFYSQWSPSTSTRDVKVLTMGSEHKIDLPPELQFEPPRLGYVGSSGLYLNRRIDFTKSD